PRLQFYFSFDDTDLKETLTLMLDECDLEPGNIQAVGAYKGEHKDHTCKEAITTLMRTLHAHYRINPNGTVDAEEIGNGEIFVEDPRVVVVRTNVGSDALWTGVPAKEIISRRKARDFANAALIVIDGHKQSYGAWDSPEYYGIIGRIPFWRIIIDYDPGVDPAFFRRAEYAAGLLEEHRTLKEVQIRL